MNSIKIKLFYFYLSNKNNNNSGFINIYYLVGFLLIIFAALSLLLPSLVTQTCGCRGTREASQYISSINKAQGAYRTENTSFATDFDALALGILSGGNVDSQSSEYYIYTITEAKEDYALIQATPKTKKLNPYVGAIFRYQNLNNLSVTADIICKPKKFLEKRSINPADIVFKNGEFKCPEGTFNLQRCSESIDYDSQSSTVVCSESN